MKKARFSSLTAHFGRLLLLAGALGGLLFGCIYFGGEALLTQFFENSDFQEQLTEKRVQDLQSYIEKNELSTRDAAQLTSWVKKQPLILLEVYRSHLLLYSSSAPEEQMDNEEESPAYDWVSYYQVGFSDGEADIVIYANDTYRWFSILLIAALILAFLLFLLIFLSGCQDLVRYICQLNNEIHAMEGGDLDASITLRGDHELSQLAKSLDDMRIAFKEQREREASIFRANQSMITEMSHDLRTPLTTLQIYTDILRLKKYDPGQLNEYLEKIDAKAAQIRQLSENIFEYSLVSHSQDVVLDPPVLFREVFHDILSEFVSHLRQQGFTFRLELDWPLVGIAVHQPYTKRLIDNIASNILKYADPEELILIKTLAKDGCVGLSFRNSVRYGGAEQESTHIGLANMKAMMEKMRGECRVLQTNSEFQIELRFPPFSGKNQVYRT